MAVARSITRPICGPILRGIADRGVGQAFAELNLLADTLDSRITFTRASTKTYYGSDGLIKTAAVNECPLEYDPVTLLPVGRSFWEARTNLCLQSTMAGNGNAPTGWTVVTTGGTPQVSLFGSNDGAQAWKFTAQNSQSFIRGNPINAAANATYVFQARIESVTDGAPDISKVIGIAGAGSNPVTYYLNGAQVAAGTPAAPGIACCVVTVGETAITPSGWIGAGVFNATTGTVVMSRPQWEQAATPGPYIPTTTSQVTRAADVATVNDLSTLRFNAAQGTLFAEGATPAFAGSGVDNVMACATRPDGEAVDRVQVRFIGNAPGVVLQSSGVVYANWQAGVLSAGVVSKQAISYSAASVSAYTNGALIGTGASASPVVTVLQLGRRGSGGFLNSNLRSIRYYPRALSNTELQAITA